MLNATFVDKIRHFGASVLAAQSPQDFEQLLKNTLVETDITLLSYHHISTVEDFKDRACGLRHALGFPDDWQSFYNVHQFHRDDPLIEYVLDVKRVVNWSELQPRSEDNARTTQYLTALETLDVGLGLSIPIFNPSSRIGIFSIGFDQTSGPLSELEMTMLQWACQVAHYRYVDIISTWPKANVSQNERDILKVERLIKKRSDRYASRIGGFSKLPDVYFGPENDPFAKFQIDSDSRAA